VHDTIVDAHAPSDDTGDALDVPVGRR